MRHLNASLPVLITRTCCQTACLSSHCCYTCVLLSASISKVSYLPGFRKRFQYSLITDSESLQTLWSDRSQLQPLKLLKRNTQFTVWVLPERPVRYPTPFLPTKDRLQREMNDLALTARMRTAVLRLLPKTKVMKCCYPDIKLIISVHNSVYFNWLCERTSLCLPAGFNINCVELLFIKVLFVLLLASSDLLDVHTL